MSKRVQKLHKSYCGSKFTFLSCAWFRKNSCHEFVNKTCKINPFVFFYWAVTKKHDLLSYFISFLKASSFFCGTDQRRTCSVHLTPREEKKNLSLRGVIVLLFLPYPKSLPGTFFQSWWDKEQNCHFLRKKTSQTWQKGDVCGWPQLSCIYQPGDEGGIFMYYWVAGCINCEGKCCLSELKMCSWSALQFSKHCSVMDIH